MTFSFAATGSVELLPMREIRSHLIKGGFKSYESTTRLVEEPLGMPIVHHGDYVPTAWLPPLIGPSIIESQTRKQYEEFIAEIMRRKRKLWMCDTEQTARILARRLGIRKPTAHANCAQDSRIRSSIDIRGRRCFQEVLCALLNL